MPDETSAHASMHPATGQSRATCRSHAQGGSLFIVHKAAWSPSLKKKEEAPVQEENRKEIVEKAGKEIRAMIKGLLEKLAVGGKEISGKCGS